MDQRREIPASVKGCKDPFSLSNPQRKYGTSRSNHPLLRLPQSEGEKAQGTRQVRPYFTYKRTSLRDLGHWSGDSRLNSSLRIQSSHLRHRHLHKEDHLSFRYHQETTKRHHL